MGKQKEDEDSTGSEIVFYSFWRPDPIPPRDKPTVPIQLLSIGTIGRVVASIVKIPNTYTMVNSPTMVGRLPIIRLMWKVENGVVLKVRSEYNHETPQTVMTISAISAVSDETFYQLYVQLHEHLGVTLFDESEHQFLTIRQFKNMLI